MWPWLLYYFPRAALTSLHSLGGLKHRELILTVLEASSPKSRHQQGPVPLLRPVLVVAGNLGVGWQLRCSVFCLQVPWPRSSLCVFLS